MSRALPFALLALLTACAADRTAILVEVTSPDLNAPGDVDELRFAAVSEYGARVDERFSIRETWPHSLTIVPPEGERMGGLTLTVSGLRGGELVVRRVVSTSFQRDTTRRVLVTFTADCRGIVCPEGIDCAAGACVGGGGSDAGVDAGGEDAGGIEDDAGTPEDAGALDAGESDAGARDAGERDAGERDAGESDAGASDAGTPDAGTPDAGTPDAGMDAGSTVRCTSTSCVGLIVISEVSPRSTTSATDEFVELYNRSETAVDVGGVELRYFSQGGTESPRGTIESGTIIPPHGYLLLVSEDYSGPVAGDPVVPRWAQGLADNGAVAIRADGMSIDTFGWGASSVVSETAPFGMSASASGAVSFERRATASSTTESMSAGGADALAGNGYDSDHNAMDFVARTTRDPQSAASPREP